MCDNAEPSNTELPTGIGISPPIMTHTACSSIQRLPRLKAPFLGSPSSDQKRSSDQGKQHFRSYYYWNIFRSKKFIYEFKRQKQNASWMRNQCQNEIAVMLINVVIKYQFKAHNSIAITNTLTKKPLSLTFSVGLSLLTSDQGRRLGGRGGDGPLQTSSWGDWGAICLPIFRRLWGMDPTHFRWGTGAIRPPQYFLNNINS